MFEVFANDYRITIQEIPLGNQGEDMARCLVIDITDAVLEFGSGGTISVRNKRNGDEMPYFATNISTVTGADAEGNVHTYIKWTLTDVDTAVAGSGFVQADYIISGVTVKTWVYKYFILPSLGITGDVPDPYEDILEEIEAQVAAVQAAAASAAASASQASAEATRIITTTESVVEDWLSDHIVTGYAVDNTLTISGAAADAKVTGDALRAAFVTEQTSGNICSFDDGADGMPLKTLAANVNALWAGSGDPTPSNPRPLTGFNGAVATVTGKNLIQLTDGTSTSTDTTFTQSASDGSVTVNGASASQRFVNIRFASGKSYLPKGVPLKISGGGNGTGLIVRICATNPITGVTANLFQSSGASPVTVGTVPEFYETVWVRVLSAAGTTYENTTIYPMVTIAEDDTTFEVGNHTEYNVSFGAAGTVYGASLDVKNGILTVTKSLATYNGNETWTATATAHGFYMTRPSAWLLRSAITTNLFKEVPAGTGTANMNPWEVGWNTTGANLLFMCDSTITTLDEWKAFLAANPLQIMYELENPVSYQLDPTTIKSILGQNNIWCDTGDITSLEYRADTRLYIEHLTHPDGDMVADANIANGSYFMVNNRLYIATAAIASGASIVPGTNCTETNLAAALNAINA